MSAFQIQFPKAQTEPPLSSRETLPTMYDLPSEDPEEPGLPDEFHILQPQLLLFTFRPPRYYPQEVFSGTDMNLYYDVNHHHWYKRPDWFGVVGVPRLYEQTDLRLSYVIWQERISPFAVVELASPGTEKEDLGETERAGERSPTKWEVYEQILRIPYYVVFNRYNDQLRAFCLEGDRYQELTLTEPRIWMPDIELGLGLWRGEYQGITRLWLRWYDAEGNWILTDAEAAEQKAEAAEQKAALAQQEAATARQEAETARQEMETARQEMVREQQKATDAEQRAEYLAQRLRELGIDPNLIN
jgi:Uma2 family endonuclease